MQHRRTKEEIKRDVLPNAHAFVEKRHRKKRLEAAAYWRIIHEEEIAYRKLCKNMDRLS